jgi:uncharacterized protein
MRAMKNPALFVALALTLALIVPYPGFAARSNAGLPAKLDHHGSIADLAAHGDAGAQYQMGQKLLTSGTTTKLKQQALVWFMLSAVSGNVSAAIESAQLLESQGAYGNAARWWFWAGKLGDGAARKRFVDLFLAGKTHGVEGKEAAIWLAERAQTNQDSSLKLALGKVFEGGLGVIPDAQQALRWYQDAAFDWNVEAMARLGAQNLLRPSVWRLPDQETDSDNRWTGPNRVPLRPLNRSEDGGLDLGRLALSKEKNVDPDHLSFDRPGMIDGEFWLKRAAARGSSDAKYTLAMAGLDGISLPLDIPRSAWRLLSAACEGNAPSAKALGNYWLHHNPTRSWVMFEVADRLGDNIHPDQWSQLTKSLTPHQIARAKQIAQDWCVKN